MLVRLTVGYVRCGRIIAISIFRVLSLGFDPASCFVSILASIFVERLCKTRVVNCNDEVYMYECVCMPNLVLTMTSLTNLFPTAIESTKIHDTTPFAF